MSTTPVLALPFPEPTDALTGGAQAMEDLALALEAKIRRRGCTLRRAAVQTIATGALASITWDTEDSDTFGFATAPDSRLTVPAGCGGLYAIAVQVLWAVIPTGAVFLDVTVDAATTNEQWRNQPANANRLWAHSIAPLPLADGQNIDVQVQHASGANRDLTAKLHMYRVGL